MEDEFDELSVSLLSRIEASEPSDDDLEDEVSAGEFIEHLENSRSKVKGGLEGIRLGSAAILHRWVSVGMSVVIGESGLGDLNTCNEDAGAGID